MERVGFSTRRVFFAAVALFALALVWRCGWNFYATGYHADERAYALPGIEELSRGHWLVYCKNTNYMAPAQEYLSVPLVKKFGLNMWSLRCPPIFFSSVAVALLFVALTRVLSVWQAVGLGVMLACPASVATTYGLHSIPNYGVGLFLVAALVLATLAVDRSRTLLSWTGLGALCGLIVYAFPTGQIQVGVSLVWLACRSRYGRSIWSGRACWGRFVGWFVAAAVSGSLLGYHYLTRLATYHPGRFECGAIAGTALLVVIGAWRLVRIFTPDRRACLGAACCLALVFAVPQVPKFYFQRVEIPRLESLQITPRKSPPYELKHLHEWKENMALYGEYVLFQLIYGHFTGFVTQRVDVRFGAKSLVTAVTLALLAVAAIPAWRRYAADGRRNGAFLLYTIPVLLTALVLAPSWLLFGDASLRYLYPYWWGMGLIFWVACFRADQKERLSGVQIGFLALFIAYSAWDCFHYLLRAT